MGRFLNGVIVGVGVGLLIVPMSGKEMQRLVRQRYEQLLSNLLEKQQLRQAGQQVAAGLSQRANVAKDVAQQAATRMQEASGNLSDLAQQSVQKVKQTGQDALGATKQAVQTVKERGQAATTPQE